MNVVILMSSADEKVGFLEGMTYHWLKGNKVVNAIKKSKYSEDKTDKYIVLRVCYIKNSD